MPCEKKQVKGPAAAWDADVRGPAETACQGAIEKTNRCFSWVVEFQDRIPKLRGFMGCWFTFWNQLSEQNHQNRELAVKWYFWSLHWLDSPVIVDTLASEQSLFDFLTSQDVTSSARLYLERTPDAVTIRLRKVVKLYTVSDSCWPRILKSSFYFLILVDQCHHSNKVNVCESHIWSWLLLQLFAGSNSTSCTQDNRLTTSFTQISLKWSTSAQIGS